MDGMDKMDRMDGMDKMDGMDGIDLMDAMDMMDTSVYSGRLLQSLAQHQIFSKRLHQQPHNPCLNPRNPW